MNEIIEPRPIEVKALQNYLIYIKFKNGEDIAPENLYNNSKPISCYSKNELIEIE